jgi:hypothetical protein
MKIGVALLIMMFTSVSFANESFKVFPSSSTTQINLGDLNTNVSLVVVYDNKGCFVMSSAVNKSNPTLEVQNLATGSYKMVGIDVFEDIVQEGQLIIN